MKKAETLSFPMVIGYVCVFLPPVKDELLLSMRFQSLVLTSMTSPPYPRPVEYDRPIQLFTPVSSRFFIL